MILNITQPEKTEFFVVSYGVTFFYRLATLSFYYLFTVFVEKWCKKNEIE
jgi:hypothetical protein